MHGTPRWIWFVSCVRGRCLRKRRRRSRSSSWQRTATRRALPARIACHRERRGGRPGRRSVRHPLRRCLNQDRGLAAVGVDVRRQDQVRLVGRAADRRRGHAREGRRPRGGDQERQGNDRIAPPGRSRGRPVTTTATLSRVADDGARRRWVERLRRPDELGEAVAQGTGSINSSDVPSGREFRGQYGAFNVLGAAGGTSDPASVWQAVKASPALRNPIIDRLLEKHSSATEDDIAWNGSTRSRSTRRARTARYGNARIRVDSA